MYRACHVIAAADTLVGIRYEDGFSIAGRNRGKRPHMPHDAVFFNMVEVKILRGIFKGDTWMSETMQPGSLVSPVI